MRIRHYLAGLFSLVFLAAPSLTLAADCSAIEAQLASLRAQATQATGLNLQILNLQITLAQLQLQECNLPPTPTDNGPKGKLMVYLNGNFYYSSDSISRTEALYNCERNSTTVAVAVFSYYCTWNGEEIFRKGDTPTSSVKLKVLSPNGGEKYAAGSNKSMSVMWEASKVPSGSIACVTLYTDNPGQTSGYAYTFPPEGGCKSAKNGISTVIGKLVRNAGYDLAPGTYKAQVSIREKALANGKDGAILAEDMSDRTFTLTGAATGAFDTATLVSSSTHPVITGTASGARKVSLDIKGYGGGPSDVTNGHWSVRIASELTAGTYDLQLSNPDDNTVLATAKLTVTGTAPKPVCTIVTTSAHHIGTSPSTIAIGDSITITWTSANASYSILPGGDKGPTSGTETYTPAASKTYTYKFVGPGGEVTCSQAVTVVGGDAPTVASTTTDTLSATPVSGVAPLQVIFSGVANKKKSCGGGARTLDFGDGKSYQISFAADLCKEKSWSVLHTYEKSGSYAAVLYGGWLVGKEAITRVGITVAPAFVEYAPTSGTSGSTQGGTTGGSSGTTVPNSTNKTPDAPSQYDTNKNTVHQTPSMLESASAYLAIQSALEAIMAQLKEIAN